MTTFDICFTPTPLLATPDRPAKRSKRWVTRLRRLLQAPRSIQTPSEQVLDGMREARSIHR